MNGLDFLLLLILAAGVVIGFVKGFVRILVGIAALVLAFVLASRIGGGVASAIEGTGWSARSRGVLGYLAVFLAVMLVGGLVAFVLRKLVRAAMLGWLDRVAGGAMGLVAALVATALLVYPIVAYASGGGKLLAHSRFAPYVAAVADLANHLAPADLARRYHEGVRKLREAWGHPERREVVGTMPVEETTGWRFRSASRCPSGPPSPGCASAGTSGHRSRRS